MRIIKSVCRLGFSLTALGMPLAVEASIAVSTATTPTTFAAAVGGSIDGFSDQTINTFLPPVLARSGGPIAYTISSSLNDAESGLFIVPAAGTIGISTVFYADTMTFDNFGSNVYAFGASLFATNILGEAASGGVTVVVTDRNALAFTQAISGGSLNSFVGFLSTVPIASVVARMTLPNTNVYVSADNVVLSSRPVVVAIPEPATWLMMIVGFVLAGFRKRRTMALTLR